MDHYVDDDGYPFIWCGVVTKIATTAAQANATPGTIPSRFYTPHGGNQRSLSVASGVLDPRGQDGLSSTAESMRSDCERLLVLARSFIALALLPAQSRAVSQALDSSGVKDEGSTATPTYTRKVSLEHLNSVLIGGGDTDGHFSPTSLVMYVCPPANVSTESRGRYLIPIHVLFGAPQERMNFVVSLQEHYFEFCGKALKFHLTGDDANMYQREGEEERVRTMDGEEVVDDVEAMERLLAYRTTLIASYESEIATLRAALDTLNKHIDEGTKIRDHRGLQSPRWENPFDTSDSEDVGTGDEKSGDDDDAFIEKMTLAELDAQVRAQQELIKRVQISRNIGTKSYSGGEVGGSQEDQLLRHSIANQDSLISDLEASLNTKEFLVDQKEKLMKLLRKKKKEGIDVEREKLALLAKEQSDWEACIAHRAEECHRVRETIRHIEARQVEEIESLTERFKKYDHVVHSYIAVGTDGKDGEELLAKGGNREARSGRKEAKASSAAVGARSAKSGSSSTATKQHHQHNTGRGNQSPNNAAASFVSQTSPRHGKEERTRGAHASRSYATPTHSSATKHAGTHAGDGGHRDPYGSPIDTASRKPQQSRNRALL